MNIQQQLDKIFRDLQTLYAAMQTRFFELNAKETENKRTLADIRRQREELIKKQNTILSQVTAMRIDRENADAKLKEAERLHSGI